MRRTYAAMSTTRAAVAPVLAAMVLVIAIVASGCGGDAATTTSQVPPDGAVTSPVASNTTAPVDVSTTAPTDTSVTAPDHPGDPGLSLDQVENAEITIEFDKSELSFALAGGSYQSATGNDPSRIKVTMSDAVAFGDLDGDTVDDAAIVIRVRSGAGQGADQGSGGGRGESETSEYVIALLSQDGVPVQAGYHLVGAGARVETVSIADGEVVVQANVAGPEQSTGGPKTPITSTLRLPLVLGGGLLLHVSQTSETAAGDVREISITSPEDGTPVIDFVEIRGNVTIAPFENNLVYHVYDPDGVELAEGPLAVESSGPGETGTFDTFVELTSLGCTGDILVTVSDVDAANGSVLAMDSVALVNFAHG